MASSSLHQVSTGNRSSSSLRRFGTILRERAWLIFLCILAGGAAATAYLMYAPKTYESTAGVKYEADVGKILRTSSPSARDSQERIADVGRALRSSSLLRSVVLAQELQENPRFSGGKPTDEGIKAAVKHLDASLTVEVPANDYMVYVTVEDQSPDLAARVANAMVDELLADYARQRSAEVDDITQRIQQALEQVGAEALSQTPAPTPQPQPAPQQPQSAPVAQDPEQAQRLAVELHSVSSQLLQADAALARLEGELSQARVEGGNPLQISSISETPGVKAARKVLLQKQVEFEQAAERYKGKHPTYTQARAAVDEARQQLDQQVAAAISQLETLAQAESNRVNDLRRQQESIQQSLQTLVTISTAPLEAPTSSPPSEASSPTPAPTTPDYSYLTRFMNDLMATREQLKILPEIHIPSLRQTEIATPSTQPSGPNQARILGYGFLGGLIAGLLLSLVFGYGDTSLREVDEVEEVLDLPVLSVVPRLRDNDSEMAAAEGFRALRTSIAVSSRDKEPRLILFTSTSPDEGKTFCALNFAVGLAQQGNKTILIECDLRRPMAAPSLSMVKVDGAGVSDFLKSSPAKSTSTTTTAKSEQAGLSFAEIRKKKSQDASPSPSPSPSSSGGMTLDDVLQRTEVTNLLFIAAGKPVSNPTELLAQPRFEEMLNQLLQRYDKIVLDSAPVLGVSETLLIASRMQGVCFVVRGNQTPRRAVLRAVQVMRRADIPLLGVVLNGISPKKSDPYGQDYYYHRSPNR